MQNKTPSEIAFHLNNLYRSEFGEKVKGRFLISHADLRALAGRARLEGGLIKQIAEALADEGLLLIHLESIASYGIGKESSFQKWRKVPKGVLAREKKRKSFSAPAAAWPFPVSIRP
ncbi:hypothetical protein [Noviherbaspirillum aridicola]|uniref:Uncharacterized protein n=1 Tax=Noviherbaspirillum aridicola TaxID=2849687 RepID=A0ABQ4Q231_9BURK|nr:hypothetical protein [Noviherbaspirillum aridicola]GIZ51096.1 hypothetical protein NCCP691_11100 [Noviherbaspirillum aridicola]